MDGAVLLSQQLRVRVTLVLTILYKNNSDGYVYIKRTQIEKFILDRGYTIIPDKCKLLTLITDKTGRFDLVYKPKPRLKILKEGFELDKYLVKSVKANGVRLTNKELKSIKFVVIKKRRKKT